MAKTQEAVVESTGEIVRVEVARSAGAIVPGSSLWDPDVCVHVKRLSLVFSNSQIVPAVYRGKPDDSFIAIHRANALDVDPLTFMQASYIVQGKLGMEAKLAIALVNARGPFKDGINWDLKGEGASREATAYGTKARAKKRCEATVSMQMAIASGWTKNDAWKKWPDLMLRYRSAMHLIRLYCPEVIMGMYSSEELRDIEVSAPPPDLVAGKLGFGKKKLPEMVEPTPEPAPAPAEAPAKEPLVNLPAEPGYTVTPFDVGIYVKNGPRGAPCLVLSVDPPRIRTAKGVERDLTEWPDKTIPWTPKGDEEYPEGFGPVEPPPEPDPPEADNEPEPEPVRSSVPAEEQPAPEEVPEPEVEPDPPVDDEAADAGQSGPGDAEGDNNWDSNF